MGFLIVADLQSEYIEGDIKLLFDFRLKAVAQPSSAVSSRASV
jgi:hypothetical protein